MSMNFCDRQGVPRLYTCCDYCGLEPFLVPRLA
jgi:hypothetical protein